MYRNINILLFSQVLGYNTALILYNFTYLISYTIYIHNFTRETYIRRGVDGQEALLFVLGGIKNAEF